MTANENAWPTQFEMDWLDKDGVEHHECSSGDCGHRPILRALLPSWVNEIIDKEFLNIENPPSL